MGLENCQIYFDNPNATYFAGQIVSGRVEFNFNSTKKLRGIHIVFKGEAHTHWTETESYKDSNNKSCTRSVSYNGNEDYFSIKSFLIGGGNNDKIELTVGKHVFPFTTTLPFNLPSSFEGEKGYVRYTVKATLDRPWKFDQTIKSAFTVICHLDCNMKLDARRPATLTMEKYLCCLCCRQGPITGVLKLPFTGFVAGQIIPYTLEIDNVSKTGVDEIIMKLKKKVIYHSHTPHAKKKTVEVTAAEFKVGEIVAARQSKTFSNNFTLPALPPSNLDNCRIIDIQYELKVTVEFDGLHANMVGNIPVIIGTIPLLITPSTTSENIANSHVTTNDRQPLLGWATGSSVHVDPYLYNPPTYEESQFGTKSILDHSDSQHTIFNNNQCYAPSYPVYNLTTMPMPGPTNFPVHNALPNLQASAPPP